MNRIKFLLFFFGFQLALSGLAGAGVPLKINFQGRLDESGQPAEGPKTFVFKLYDASSGGNLVWTSQSQSISVSQGIFSAVLSAGTPASLSTAAFSGARYVEMIVDGVILSPRQEMVAAPYALVAQALAPDAVIPSASLGAGSVTDAAVLLSTAAISSGKFGDERVSITTGAFSGGFNGPGQLLKLDGAGSLPAAQLSALGAQVIASSIAVGAVQDSAIISLSASKLAGPLPASQVASGQLGAQVIVSSIAVGSVQDSAIVSISASKITGTPPVSAGSVGPGPLGNDVIASSVAIGSIYPDSVQLGTYVMDITGNAGTVSNGVYETSSYPDPAWLTSIAGSKVSGNIPGDAAGITGSLPPSQLAPGQLGAQVIASSVAVNKVYGAAILAGAVTDAKVLLTTAAISSGRFGDDRILISTGAFYGGFNAGSKLVQLDGAGALSIAGDIATAGKVGAGTTSPNSKLSAGGAISLPIIKVSSDYQITENDSTVLVDASLNSVAVTLPSAAGITGRIYTVKFVDTSNGATLSAQAGETIDNSPEWTDTPNMGIVAKDIAIVQSDGANWVVIGQWINW